MTGNGLEMDRLNLLSVALGLACLAGLNLYLTVFATGLAIHFHWIVLAPQYQSLAILGQPIVVIISGVLFLLEFFADKIDRKSTRLNSSHVAISYAVFCLKKKTLSHVVLWRVNS